MENLKRFEYPFVDEKYPKKRENIQLTMGIRQVEYNRGNCGIILYWHGRPIEVLTSFLFLCTLMSHLWSCMFCMGDYALTYFFSQCNESVF